MRRLVVRLLLAATIQVMSGCVTPDSGRIGEQPAGWAASGRGTSGGAAAPTQQRYTVHTRRELIAALHDGDYPAHQAPSNNPKIIYIDDEIDVNVDDDNRVLVCNDYVRDGYNIDAFVKAYEPKVWGREPPTGLIETARKMSHDAQEQRVRVRVGSNTTILGKGGAVLKGAWLDIQNQTNVIVRDVAFVGTFDCFPAWEPKDGEGAWNSEYDFISIRGSDRVWIDHNSFDDGATADSTQPHYFGKHYQVHDGAVDITEGADLVTVSWNRFVNHDKVMLIGSSDSRSADRGKLRVSLHHNLFESVGQRMPRVRFGQVHVANNLYRVLDNEQYQYSWGVGAESRIYAENNVIVSAVPLDSRRIVRAFKGTAVYAAGTLVNNVEIDVMAAFNLNHKPDLVGDVGWKPERTPLVDAVRDVEALVFKGAGPRK